MVTFKAIKNQEIGAVTETFIEEIFENVCQGTTFSLKRESSHNIPTPGTFSSPTFDVFDSYTERIVASFSDQTESYCNHGVFQEYFIIIQNKLIKEIELRRKEHGLE